MQGRVEQAYMDQGEKACLYRYVFEVSSISSLFAVGFFFFKVPER